MELCLFWKEMGWTTVSPDRLFGQPQAQLCFGMSGGAEANLSCVLKMTKTIIWIPYVRPLLECYYFINRTHNLTTLILEFRNQNKKWEELLGFRNASPVSSQLTGHIWLYGFKIDLYLSIYLPFLFHFFIVWIQSVSVWPGPYVWAILLHQSPVWGDDKPESQHPEERTTLNPGSLAHFLSLWCLQETGFRDKLAVCIYISVISGV